MLTFEKALAVHHIEVPPHLLAQAEVPALPGEPQAQGDLYFEPTRPSKKLGELVPREGVQLVRGEASANTHWLDAYEGPVYWAPATAGGADLGVMTIPVGSVAQVTHTDEHGANRFDALADGPGAYLVRRQRQQAEEIQLVAD